MSRVFVLGNATVDQVHARRAPASAWRDRPGVRHRALWRRQRPEPGGSGSGPAPARRWRRLVGAMRTRTCSPKAWPARRSWRRCGATGDAHRPLVDLGGRRRRERQSSACGLCVRSRRAGDALVRHAGARRLPAAAGQSLGAGDACGSRSGQGARRFVRPEHGADRVGYACAAEALRHRHRQRAGEGRDPDGWARPMSAEALRARGAGRASSPWVRGAR